MIKAAHTETNYYTFPFYIGFFFLIKKWKYTIKSVGFVVPDQFQYTNKQPSAPVQFNLAGLNFTAASVTVKKLLSAL